MKKKNASLPTKRKPSAAPKGRGASTIKKTQNSGGLTMELSLGRRMPAEWEKHDATWIAWPHHEPDWPGKLAPIPWVYAEIVRALADYDKVEILCHDTTVADNARAMLAAHGVKEARYRLHTVSNDRVWLRDSAPTGVLRADGRVELINWGFNGWAKYDNYKRDAGIGAEIERLTGLPRIVPIRPDTGERLILEGGGIEVNGAGRMLVTEEWLLTPVQVRNPGMLSGDYEKAFDEYLGITDTIWLGQGAAGDDTHGHVDDIARFSSRDTVILAYEQDPSDENHARSVDNLRRLQLAAKKRPLRITTIPFPRPVTMNGERLPASYANFYIANGAVLVPTFNDPSDRVALNGIAEAFPRYTVIGIHAVDLVWGFGTLHCLTQQQPSGIGGKR
ncbi:MAG: agmatine deiminase [Gemmatimonadaceae bacterium]|nr:agmatine deiminase [Gemmatimonadaceae bacterium]